MKIPLLYTTSLTTHYNTKMQEGSGRWSRGTRRLSNSFFLTMVWLALLLGVGKNHIHSAVAAYDFEVDCDPCIERGHYHLHAVLYKGNSELLGDQVESQQVVSSMEQAAKDMGVRILISLPKTMDELLTHLKDSAVDPTCNGLIVSIPDDLPDIVSKLESLNLKGRKPIFGINVGPSVAKTLELEGHIAQDNVLVGSMAAQEFLKSSSNGSSFLGNLTAEFSTSNTTTPSSSSKKIDQAVIVLSELDPVAVNEDRYLGFEQALRGYGTSVVDKILINPLLTDGTHEKDIDKLFQDCPYQAVLLTRKASVSFAVIAKERNSCTDTQIGVTDVSLEIYNHLTQKTILFGLDPQVYLRSTLSVVLATLHVTTGKRLSVPLDTNAYHSGPVIITQNTVPTDTLQQSHISAFPSCQNTEEDTNDMGSMSGFNISAITSAEKGCVDRSLIRIAGVLHGDTSDVFWDPVFAAAEQAALDMGIQLDLIRFQPIKESEVLHQKMAQRIRSLCESGIDGIFVSIPSIDLLESIELCQQLQVPVISVNTGEELSKELNLHHHIAQSEYNAGSGAALMMIEAGMKFGFCPDHAVGNPATAERCRGFEDAIKTTNGQVTYNGTFSVQPDNRAQYKIDVENFINMPDTNIDWEGVGLLSLGPAQIEGLRDVVAAHPKVIAGTFDVAPIISEALADGWLKFGIDQQPFLQGILPIYILTYLSYSKESLLNHEIESGPKFVTKPPSAAESFCEANNFEVCLPRPFEQMNMIPVAFLGFGYAMFTVITGMCLIAAVWTFYYRKERIVSIGQPILLMMVIIGCFISNLSILFLGVQTTYRNEQDSATRLPTGPENGDITFTDASCMAFPWLYGMGFVLAFSALFAKIQRIKLIYKAGMRMQRRAIGLKDVAYIIAVTFFVEMTLLGVWQIIEPLRWEREVVSLENGFPRESVGGCTYGESWYFIVSVTVFHVICLFYALVLCFQTKDINSDFAESSYISLAVAFMFQVLVLVVPISALVMNESNVFYFVRVCATFLQNFTVLALLFIPKMIRLHYYKPENTSLTSGSVIPDSIRPSFGGGYPRQSSQRLNASVSSQVEMELNSSKEFLELPESAAPRRQSKFSSSFLASGGGKKGVDKKALSALVEEESSCSKSIDIRNFGESFDNISPPIGQDASDVAHCESGIMSIPFDEPSRAMNQSENKEESSQEKKIASDQWVALGFKSEEQCKLILSLADASTTTEERQMLLSLLKMNE